MARVESTDARLESVRTTAAELNAISDQAAESVRRLEEFLSVDCGAGVFASVLLSAEYDGGSGEYVTELCYGRRGPKFRIFWRGICAMSARCLRQNRTAITTRSRKSR